MSNLLPGHNRRGAFLRRPARAAPLLAVLAVALLVALAHVAQAATETPDHAPVNLSARAADGGIVLEWDPPAAGDPAGYRILRRHATDPAKLSVLVADTGSAATRYVDRAVRPETGYVYRVEPVGAAVGEARSNFPLVKTPPLPAAGGGRVAERPAHTAAFASVSSSDTDGNYKDGETIDVRVTFTEPVSLERFSITDGGTDAGTKTFAALAAASDIVTHTIGGKHYALVASQTDSGVQIIDITDPASPTAVASVTDGADYPALNGAIAITTHTIGTSHYALVASFWDDGVQIINITNPSSPSAVASVTDGADFPALDGAQGIAIHTIGSRHYALVASNLDDGVQIIDITDPSSPSAAASVTDGAIYSMLDGAHAIATHTIGAKHYALVASQFDDGVQIINITDPSSPSAVANVTDGADYPALNGAGAITTHTVGDKHYALVASRIDDGVQIINITDPSSPSAVASVTDGADFPALDGAQGIAIHTIGSNHYALVASDAGFSADDGVQIIDITEPANPSPVASVKDGADYPTLSGAWGIAAHTMGSRHYALVAAISDDGVQMIDITEPAIPFDPLAPYLELDLAGDRRAIYADSDNTDANLVFEYTVREEDRTADLAYQATDSLKLGPNTLTDADDSTDLSGVALPAPGAPNSLSANRNISLNTALVTSVTSTTPDGDYDNGSTIDVRVGFTDTISLERFGIEDGGSDAGTETFDELDGATAIATHAIAGRLYALVASSIDHGVQIIDITNPSSPVATASVTDGADYPALRGARGIATHTIGASHYALVTGQSDDGVQIINITDPKNPSAVTSVTDGADYPELNGALGITTHTIEGSHYALVTGFNDDGVQIIDITDPENPSAVASVTQNSAFRELDGPSGITTHTIGSKHYALVAGFEGDGVQIINITTPASPSAVANIAEGADYPELENAANLAIHTVGGRHYALVTAFEDNGVQVIDITDPENPSPAAHITDGDDFPALDGAFGITTRTIGSRHYALVASVNDDGVQMIDITVPSRPFDALLPYVELDLAGDHRAIYADSDNTDANLVFEYTVRGGERTTDLAYKATDSLKLGANILEDADVTLPAPGAANSLSANKEISLNRPAMLENVTSTTSDGNYNAEATIDVRVTFTEPVSLDRFTIHDGGSDAGAGTFDVLDGAHGIATHTIGGSHYALVASQTTTVCR